MADTLRNIGAQMANVMFNLAQRPGELLTGDVVATMDSLRKQWDEAVHAIPPSPSTAPEVGDGAVLEAAARIAASYGSGRPIVERRPNDRILGRWEGEQAASANIARMLLERAALASRPAEVDDKRHQDLIDVFDLTWSAAVESAAFYVDGHCADGAHHVEHILELVPPKIVVGGVTVAEVRARRATADAELWETAMSHAANYVENHCIDGEDHASHMMSMRRPEFGAPPAITAREKRIAVLEQENADLRFNIGELMKALVPSHTTNVGGT